MKRSRASDTREGTARYRNERGRQRRDETAAENDSRFATETDGGSYESVHEAFLAMEAGLSLFEREVFGVPVWERIRFDVNKQILQKTGVLGEAYDGPAESTALHRGRDLLEGLLWRHPRHSPDADIVVFGHPRRKQLEDGVWWNVRCDPVVERLDSSWILLESPVGHGHRRPAKTANLGYLDAIERGAKLQRRIVPTDRPPAVDRAFLARVREAIRTRFGVDVDVRRKVERMQSMRRYRLPRYVSLLERIDPNLVVLTVSYGYGKETQIEACKRLGIPVVELQHGVIDPYHVGYAYPGPRRNKQAFPDHLLVYGSFWRDTVEYPIPDERVHPVGYPFLERELPKYDDVETTDQLVFVSQGAIGHQLSTFAAELAERPEVDLDIVYKLHPAETKRYPEEYPWLVDADLRVADGTEDSLYELFAASAAQVGVYSTAVYEGLRFGLDTYVVDLPGAVKLRPLVEDGSATLVESVDYLTASLQREDLSAPFDHERFFAPNALEVVPATIDELARTDGGDRRPERNL